MAATNWVHYNMKDSPTKGKEVWDVKKLLEVREATTTTDCIKCSLNMNFSFRL